MAMAEGTETGGRPGAAGREDVAAPVIVVGLDGSPSSWDAFCWAAGEAVRINARIVAVYVIPLADPAAALGSAYDYAGVERARQQVADELRAEAAHRADEVGVSLSFVTQRGDCAYALNEVARRAHAYLVVVGRSAKLLHHLAGSLSRRLTSRHDAPVVVVVP
jgi:nucleotide-binding universal stress UspA family protein